MKESNCQKFRAIDYFCCGGGMTCGMRRTGIDVFACVGFEKKP